MSDEMFSASSSSNSGINRMQEVPTSYINPVASDNFPGAQNISQDHPPLPSLPNTPVPDCTVPKYYQNELGSYPNEKPRNGSFGQVKKVFSSYIGAAALKELRYNLEMTDDSRRQWRREFDNLYWLNHHPYIVGLYGYVYASPSDKDPIGILMEFMLGGSLQECLLAGNGHSIADNVKNTWIKQIALGLNFIHSLDMMHRDIKPDNILLSQNGLIAKIADLGLAKKLSPIEHNTMCVGNPVYTAPEVYMDSVRYSKSADIWSYGMLLYFIYYVSHPYDPKILIKIPPLTRVRVWRGEDTSETRMNWRPVLAGYPIDTVITQCWETIPENRCTIKQVVDCLHSPVGMAEFPSLAV